MLGQTADPETDAFMSGLRGEFTMRIFSVPYSKTATIMLLLIVALPVCSQAGELAVATPASLAGSPASTGQTLRTVAQRGHLACGVSGQMVGFAHVDRQGNWRGFDVELCRAVAATILGDADKTRYVPLEATRRQSAVQSGEIDMLSGPAPRPAKGTAPPDTELAGISYHNRQGFLVRREGSLRSPDDLPGATVCVQRATAAEANITDYLATSKMAVRLIAFDSQAEMRTALFNGRCDALTAALAQLRSTRAAYAPNPHDFRLLAQTVSSMQRGPVLRPGDSQFAGIVRAVLDAEISAEEYDVTSGNIDALTKSNSPSLQKFIGFTAEAGRTAGLNEGWAQAVIRQVGNYGEIYERHLGAGSELKIPRGLNLLASQGGALSAPSARVSP